MKRCIAVAFLLVTVNATTAAGYPSAAEFGWQLDCATKKALNTCDPYMPEQCRLVTFGYLALPTAMNMG